MAAYHKVEVSLNTNAVEVGIPSPQTVNVVVPTIGPTGPTGSVGPVGPTGPQGVPGTGLEVLTVQGDLLYQGASTGQRLPIGTSGQVLKVANGIPAWGNESGAVTSVNGEVGAVTITASSIDAAADNHSHQPADIFADAAKVASSSAIFSGIYFRNGDDNGKGLYEDPDSRNYFWWDSDLSKWFLANAADSNRFESSSNTLFPWQATGWTPISPQTGTLTVAQANLYEASGASANESLLRTPKSGNATSDQLVLGSDSRLSDSRTPSSHAHGNLTNSGAVGTTANLPLKTGTNGVIEAGSFGTAAGSFCAGDDARLSDARTPSSTLVHKASHATGGTDALAPSDIGAQSIFVTESLVITTPSQVNLTSARSKIFDIIQYAGQQVDVKLPSTNAIEGDVFVFRWGTGSDSIRIIQSSSGSPVTTVSSGEQKRLIRGSVDFWSVVPVDTHTHAATAITSGTLDIARLPVGTGSTQVAAGNHTHVVADVTGAAASGSITSSGLTQATARILGRTSASTGSIEEIQIGSGLSLSAGELSSTVSAGIPATILDAKGDLIVGSADNTAARLAVGATNGHALVVDSAETLGMKWSAVSGVTSGSVDNAILRADGTGGAASQSSDLVIDDATTSTANNVAITNQHSGQTNSSLVLSPKGTGAIIIGPKPDGTTTGGNARGSYAFDFVTNRSAATQVASGANAFAFGFRCTASGNYGAAFGFASTASGEAAFAAGQSTASNIQSAALGNSSASGIYSFSTGTGNAGGRASCAVGEDTHASGDYSLAFGVRTRATRHSQFSHASGRFASSGDVQNSRFHLFVKTTNATATEMTMDGTRLSIPSGRVMGMIVNIVGAKSDGSAVAHYVRQVACKNVAGTSTLVGAVTTIGADQEDNASTDVAITISDANDAVTISVTGIASETWRWCATVDCSEFAYGT